MHIKGLFVTGTDTGVGKTYVTSYIVKMLRHRGIDAIPMKPVQTGGKMKGRVLESIDISFCLNALGIDKNRLEINNISPYVLKFPCSPHLAARLENVKISLRRIKKAFYSLLNFHKFVIVEGAGGILVPLNRSRKVIDIAGALNLPVVLVARAGLGTLNHVFLSIYYLKSRGFYVPLIFLNRTSNKDPDYIVKDNFCLISEKLEGTKVILLEYDPYLKKHRKLSSVNKDKFTSAVDWIIEKLL